MTIQTDYGTVEYESKDLLIFPDGLFGFPKLTRYLLLRISEDDDSILLMMSVEGSSVAFTLFNPFFLCPDYSPVLTPEELMCLGAEESGELSYYVICVVRDDYLENTVNLKCPIVIHPQTRNGIQVILANSAYGYRHKLRSFPSITENITNVPNGSDNHADSST